MITSLNITNFKSLQDVTLDFSNLNLLFGVNGVGKSSVLQSLLLLRQSFLKGVLDKGLVLRNGELVSIGTGKDALYQFAEEEVISFRATLNGQKDFFFSFEYNGKSDLLSRINIPDKKNSEDNSSIFGNAFQYLNAEHIPAKDTYQKSDYEVVQNRSLGIRGEFAPHFLSEFGNSEKVIFKNLLHPKGRSTSLIHQVDAWLSEISPGIKLTVEDVRNLDLIRLAFAFETEIGYTNEFKPTNVGFGITYALPVIVAILIAKPGDLLLIENPESHLHPRGQSSIGRLMALAAQNGVQLLIESHSDHVINGIRVAIKGKELLPENARVFYFLREMSNERHETKVIPILIDGNGELNDYPPGLLDEWSLQLMKLF